MLEKQKIATCGTINVHETQARTVCFKRRTFLVDRIGDDNVVTDGLHVEGHIGTLQALVHEGMFRELAIERILGGVFSRVFFGWSYKVKCTVINIHTALGKIRGVEILLAINESAGQAGVAGSVGSFDHGHSLGRWRRSSLGYTNSWVPSGNRPINRAEEEHGRFSWGQQKICLTAIEDGAGWRTRWLVLVSRIGWRDRDDQRLLNSCAVVKCTEARRVVGDPPG